MRECRCTPQQVARYRDRLSGPLRDRLDLTVEVPALPAEVLAETTRGESSAAVRVRVEAARARQAARYRADGFRTNAEMTPVLMTKYCALDGRGQRLLTAAVTRLALSARAYDRVRKVARTVADLAGDESVAADHLGEALQFRMH